MRPQIKRAWIKALRNGKYRQGRERLRTKKGFCCLGVLCDLHSKTLKRSQWHSSQYGNNVFWSYGTTAEYLPKSVQRWAGLREYDPTVGSTSLAGANDSRKLNFKKIADLIEKHL